MKEGEGGRKGEDISSDVHQASGRRALKAMLGNGRTNIIDAELRKLEFIAIGIEQFAILGFRIDQLVRQFRVDQVA